MARHSLSGIPLLVLSIVSCVLAQSTSGTTSPTTSAPASSATSSMASATSSSSISMPSTSTNDTAPGSTNNNNNNDNQSSFNSGPINYYIVFIALVLCVVGLLVFFVWRRKRRAMFQLHSGRQVALTQDLHAWDPARSRRRYWQGRHRSAETSREEGLDENGEAPPPYIPKSRGEEAGGEDGPAIPLQTLAREDAGLKPPDYEAPPVHESSNGPVGMSYASPSTSSHP